MTFNFRLSRHIVGSIAVTALVAVTAAVALGLSYPEPVSSGALGPDWQCSRLAFVFTSCTHVVRFKTASAEPARAPVCPRPRGLRNALGLLP